MADLNSTPNSPGEEELRQTIEMLFFAYRDFTGEPDAMLRRIGLGRAHHRTIYFVGRNPGITVKELLAILKITKQSLARVLGQLVRDGYIARRQSDRDRRKRLLYLTAKGVSLEQQLTEKQRERIARAYLAAGSEAAAGFRSMMLGIMDPSDRWRFDPAQEDAPPPCRPDTVR